MTWDLYLMTGGPWWWMAVTHRHLLCYEIMAVWQTARARPGIYIGYNYIIPCLNRWWCGTAESANVQKCQFGVTEYMRGKYWRQYQKIGSWAANSISLKAWRCRDVVVYLPRVMTQAQPWSTGPFRLVPPSASLIVTGRHLSRETKPTTLKYVLAAQPNDHITYIRSALFSAPVLQASLFHHWVERIQSGLQPHSDSDPSSHCH